jgi:site-specific DNA recombinase
VPTARTVAIYARVSSEDQAERGTVQTQLDELDRWLERAGGFVIVERYVDDGVSGTIPLAARPAGGRLLRDAAAGRFDVVAVYKVDRLGRDAVDLLVVRRRLDDLRVKLVSVVEGEPDLLGYDVQAVVADHYRREFLRRSADGMNRAAREGRYTGGIVAYGYRVEGNQQTARLVPDEEPTVAGLSAAGAVRWMYDRLAIDHWSCRRIAAELNALGLPTHYWRDEREVHRGERGERTRGIWRTGRIRNVVTQRLYRGELSYGRRSSKRDREVISATVAPLVSPGTWDAAQETLTRNRLIPKNTERIYLLRGVLTCGLCQLRYGGTQGREGVWWYRCGGRRAERGQLEGRCPNRLVRGEELERLIWADVERFLRDPGGILAELDGHVERENADAIAAAQAITLSHRLDTLQTERTGFVRLAARGSLTDAALDAELARIDADRAEIERRLAELAPRRTVEPVPTATNDLFAQLRTHLDAGLSAAERHEIVSNLVRAMVHLDLDSDGASRTRIVVEYRFPPATGGVTTRTGTGSSPPRVRRPGQANRGGASIIHPNVVPSRSRGSQTPTGCTRKAAASEKPMPR